MICDFRGIARAGLVLKFGFRARRDLWQLRDSSGPAPRAIRLTNGAEDLFALEHALNWYFVKILVAFQGLGVL